MSFESQDSKIQIISNFLGLGVLPVWMELLSFVNYFDRGPFTFILFYFCLKGILNKQMVNMR